MLGLSYAAVPLYDLFCRVTGFGGTTQNASNKEIPKIIVNFSLIFILIFNHALILLVNQLAFLNNLSSSYKDETS